MLPLQHLITVALTSNYTLDSVPGTGISQIPNPVSFNTDVWPLNVGQIVAGPVTAISLGSNPGNVIMQYKNTEQYSIPAASISAISLTTVYSNPSSLEAQIFTRTGNSPPITRIVKRLQDFQINNLLTASDLRSGSWNRSLLTKNGTISTCCDGNNNNSGNSCGCK